MARTADLPERGDSWLFSNASFAGRDDLGKEELAQKAARESCVCTPSERRTDCKILVSSPEGT